ncbi:MAG: phosphohydrolase [Candidatus Eremiobacteraeota bacterium]|nr:phosphohydrolase [Candidatus Eremiobacteraeota bacterium]
MDRSDFLQGITVIAATVPLSAAAATPPRSVAGIGIPDSPLARDATAAARESLPPEIFNHSLRTFLFAELVSKAKKVDHDVEAVYVASILHDTGLANAHMSAGNRFEVDGANLAREILMMHGITGERAEVVWDAIALHDSSLARWKGPEVRLVSSGVNADFGAFLNDLDHADVRSVLAAAPRTNFIPAFLNAVAAVAKKKPNATGNCFVTDVAYRMVPGFHLSNFVDDVRSEDPFAAL